MMRVPTLSNFVNQNLKKFLEVLLFFITMPKFCHRLFVNGTWKLVSLELKQISDGPKKITYS